MSQIVEQALKLYQKADEVLTYVKDLPKAWDERVTNVETRQDHWEQSNRLKFGSEFIFYIDSDAEAGTGEIGTSSKPFQSILEILPTIKAIRKARIVIYLKYGQTYTVSSPENENVPYLLQIFDASVIFSAYGTASLGRPKLIISNYIHSENNHSYPCLRVQTDGISWLRFFGIDITLENKSSSTYSESSRFITANWGSVLYISSLYGDWVVESGTSIISTYIYPAHVYVYLGYGALSGGGDAITPHSYGGDYNVFSLQVVSFTISEDSYYLKRLRRSKLGQSFMTNLPANQPQLARTEAA